MQDIQKKTGQKIRELREKKKISQEAFGDLCGLNRSHMSEIERGEWNLTLGTLVKIAKHLDTTVSALLKGIA